MKLIKFANLLVFGAILTAIVPGCTKRPGQLENITAGKTDNPTVPTPPVPPFLPDTNVARADQLPAFPQNEATNHMFWSRDTEILKVDTVHFGFDSAVVRADQKPRVAAIAAYLKANPAKAVLIEGYCDERGTAAYNLSLGERRALAVRGELIRLGIEPRCVDTISYGYEKPVDPGHNEAAWAKNRRGEPIALTPPSRPLE
jgi:peptidoglycan-associated lipoprotein